MNKDKLFELYVTLHEYSYEADIVKAKELMIKIIDILGYDYNVNNCNIYVINHFIKQYKRRAIAKIYKLMVSSV